MIKTTILWIVALFISSPSFSQTVVINEVMASNSTTMADPAGEFDDWVELYNNTASAIDISGYFLSDTSSNLNKWVIPPGTLLQANNYLIIWADEDSSQGPYHANFKLSASAEQLFLSDPAQNILDSVSWGQQITDMGLARVPNGTGNFIIQPPTFAANNSPNSISHFGKNNLVYIYPVPADEVIYFSAIIDHEKELSVFNALGQKVYSYAGSIAAINSSLLPNGIYCLKCGMFTKSFIIQHK